MSGPKFTIIVPVYGVETYMLRCADTVLGQTYGNIQFVFVNDGTEDNSMGVLDELINEKYSHLKGSIHIINKANEGLPAARRTGMEYATGDYIMHVDADDWLETDAVAQIAAKAEETDADIICFRFYKEEKKRIKNRGDRKYTNAQKDVFLRDIITHKAYGYVWNKCAKRSLYVENPVTFAKYGMFEDVFLMTQLVYHASTFAHIDAPLYHYRRTNVQSISRQKRATKRLYSSMNMLDLYRLYSDHLSESPLKETAGRILYHAAWCSIFYDLKLFDRYPELSGLIRNIPIGRSNLLPLFQQLIVKLYVLSVK